MSAPEVVRATAINICSAFDIKSDSHKCTMVTVDLGKILPDRMRMIQKLILNPRCLLRGERLLMLSLWGLTGEDNLLMATLVSADQKDGSGMV